MKLIKMLGLAAIAAFAAMAFVGVTAASAANTALCEDHTSLVCDDADSDEDEDTGEGADPPGDTVVVNQTGSGTLLGSLNITCDSVTGSGTALALANPQPVHITALLFDSCETSGKDDCIVTVLELPLSVLNKTGLDSGTLTGTNGQTLVECEDVFFTVDVHCVYDATGLEFSVGAQHLTANDTPVTEIGNDSLCPNNPTLDGLLVTTANRYVLA